MLDNEYDLDLSTPELTAFEALIESIDEAIRAFDYDTTNPFIAALMLIREAHLNAMIAEMEF